MYSRDFSSDPNYTPAWRAQQALEYRRAYQEAQQRGEQNPSVIPLSEDDKYVIDFYSLLVHGACHYPEVRYAYSCFCGNVNNGLGTTIQAMFLGGKNIEDIAKSFRTKRKNIDCYLKLFFDVEEYLDCDTLIYSLISPYNKSEQLTEDVAATCLWLGLSYAFGWQISRNLLQRRMNVATDVSKKISESMRQSLEMQASEFVLGARMTMKARPCDFERHISLTNAMSIAEQNKTAEGAIANGDYFRKALWGGIKEVSSSLDYNDPVRKMIGDKERELSLKDNQQVKQIEYSAPQAL